MTMKKCPVVFPLILILALGVQSTCAAETSKKPTRKGYGAYYRNIRRVGNVGEGIYEFDTGQLLCDIEPYGRYHGIKGLMHIDELVNIVSPSTAFLNAEYYQKPGYSKNLPRQITLERKVTHKLSGNTVTLHFPTESEFGLEMDLAYTAYGDTVDMQMTISPTKDVPGFEIFFASYICEALDETWVPLKNSDKSEQWVKLNNREVFPKAFYVARDSRLYGRSRKLSKLPECESVFKDRFFSKPILVARNSASGFALIFLCDPKATPLLAGRYHGWNTAHDWSFGSDLVKDRQLSARARMVYRRFESTEQMFAEIAKLWTAFEKEGAIGKASKQTQ